MTNETDNISLATDLTVAWLANPNTRANPDDVPAFLASVHDALGKLGTATADEAETKSDARYEPAVSVRKSLADPNFIISMLDGKPYKSLKRHLSANGLTPDQYRERYGLKADYPMTAPAYSAVRSAAARAIGLGRKAVEKVAETVADEKPAPKARKGKSVADAKKAAKAHLGGAE
jgi:predicted transcriptional regulator